MTEENDLEPLDPGTAKEMYHREREGEGSERVLLIRHTRIRLGSLVAPFSTITIPKNDASTSGTARS